MSRDVKIPEWAMKMAREHLDNYLYGKMSPDEAIAIALLAAEQRGRERVEDEAAMERAAKAAYDADYRVGSWAEWDEIDETEPANAWLKNQYRAYALAAIRSLGEKI